MSLSSGSSAPSSSPRSPGPISAASTSSPPRRASFSRPDRSRSSSRWRPAGSRRSASATAPLVQAGDVLVELDRSAALADAEGARAELASARAEILRRKTALASAQSHRFDPAAGDRLAGRRRARVARARNPCSRRRSRTIGGERRRVRRRADAKDRRSATSCARPSRRRRTSSRPCRSASTCAPSSSK